MNKGKTYLTVSEEKEARKLARQFGVRMRKQARLCFVPEKGRFMPLYSISGEWRSIENFVLALYDKHAALRKVQQ